MQVVGVVLIVMGALAKGASVVTSLPTVAGIIAAGVFLFLVAILGLYGAAHHHQVILFFVRDAVPSFMDKEGRREYCSTW